MSLASDLRQFTGSDTVYRHALVPNFVYTEGVKYLAKEAEAYWLLDAIASHYFDKKSLRKIEADEAANALAIWTLTRDGEGAVLQCKADTYCPILVEQRIAYTDFPFTELSPCKFYCGWYGEKRLLMLPSEY